MIKTDLMKKKPIGLCKVDPQNITVIYGFRADEKGEAWGYGCAVKDEAEYLARLRSLFTAAKKMPILGYCYTQLTDVQQEVNGLLKEDRTPKVALEEIRKLNEIEV